MSSPETDLGSWSVWSLSISMISRVSFYPTLLFNIIMEKVSSRQWYNRIDDTVILGALPFRNMTKQLKDENVSGVITLNEQFETRYFVNSAEEWQEAGIQQIRLETPDLVAAPTQDQLKYGVNFLLQCHNDGKSVYVHCKAGRTRSATVVASYLMQIHNWTPEIAIEYIKDKRPHIIIRSQQWNALREYYVQNIEQQ